MITLPLRRSTRRRLPTALAALVVALAGSGSTAVASEFASAGQVWSSAALPTAAAGGASGAAYENTLAGVYELALENDPVLAVAEATLRAGREERRLGLAGLLPQVNAQYNAADTEQDSDGAFAAGAQVFPNQTQADVDSTDWNVRLQQPLFDLAAWFNFRRGAELSEQASATFEQAQQDLIVRVVSAYFGVLRASANLSASRAQEDALEAQLDQVQQRFEVGLVAMTDVFDAQAAYDTAVADRVADAAALDVALELLSVITGQPHAQLWELDDEFPVVDPTPDDVSAWLEFALTNNVDLDVARLGRDVALAQARAAASAHLPTVSLSLTRSASNSDITQTDLISGTISDFERNNDSDTIALSLSMPLFSGGAVSARRRQAYAQFDSSSQQVEQTRRNITQLTRAQYINVKRDVARTRARAQAIVSTQSALEAAQTGYEVGTRNVVDVLIAQRAVFSAIRDHANSIIDFVQDVVSLKRQAGILTPADIVELNRWLTEPAAPTLSSVGTSGADDMGYDD